MKMTVIVNDRGELVAAQQGSDSLRGQDAGLVAGPGQHLHVIDIPDEVKQHLADPKSFAERIQPLIPRV
ncbi:hypothetical protein PTE30175_03776 [Pandoraea terrae]|uniref:Uncharacterized protein n=1 Tax=Pandoraea terrae TaxID=1537710 RepID=A0A5E4XGD8_9BURK|nr:hypothetical protein [Pandoraea terrae]VVE35444.1 hypothetical protein PTE30175_03776 [Pandoraea terrae]